MFNSNQRILAINSVRALMNHLSEGFNLDSEKHVEKLIDIMDYTHKKLWAWLAEIKQNKIQGNVL